MYIAWEDDAIICFKYWQLPSGLNRISVQVAVCKNECIRRWSVYLFRAWCVYCCWSLNMHIVQSALKILFSEAHALECKHPSTGTELLRLWSHCIRIWPIFYTDIHCRQRQKKQMRFSKWRWSQWRRAALTCTDMFRRLTVETKSFCFFQPCMPVCRVVLC